MKVYKIDLDVDIFQSLAQPFESLQERDARKFRCQPVTWPLTPPDVYSQWPKLKAGDFWDFNFSFAMPEGSAEKVRNFMDEAGELLPLPFKGQTMLVLNVLKCVDCMDMTKSDRIWLNPCVFFADTVPDGLFKVPTVPHDIFVSERTADPATEFKAFVENAGMTGLIFREVWDGEE